MQIDMGSTKLNTCCSSCKDRVNNGTCQNPPCSCHWLKPIQLSVEQNLEDFLLSIKVGLRNLMQQARAEGVRDIVGQHFMMPEEKASHMVNKIHSDARKEILELSIARIIGFVETTMEQTAMQVLSTKDKLTFVRMLRDKLTNNHDIYEVPKTKATD